MQTHMPKSRAARGGFTLVELLVVMGVIAILMALLVPAAMAIRKQVRITQTTAMIEGISAALNSYKQVWNAYPPDKNAPLGLTKSAQCLVYYLSGASICYSSSTNPTYKWNNSIYNLDALGAGRDSKIVLYTFKWSALMNGGSNIPMVVDPWLKPMIYNAGGSADDANYNQYELPSGASVVYPKHNPGGFDLFAGGPDGLYGTSDDIKNWDDQSLDNYNKLQ